MNSKKGFKALKASSERIDRLCRKHTDLDEEEIGILIEVAKDVHMMSELTGNDIFVDAMVHNGVDSVVLAWGSPGDHSLYKTSVVGAMAFATSEPAVYKAMMTQETTRDVRGISQEGVPIAQTVTPIKNAQGKAIGVLIMERNITAEIKQEKQVEFLAQTAENLSNTLMYLSVSGSSFEDWFGNGVFVLNSYGKITYANKEAAEMYRLRLQDEPLGSDFARLFPGCSSIDFLFSYLQSPVEISFEGKVYCLRGYNLISYGEASGCVVSVQDITDMRKKDQELNAKSTIISEIHHRVKNNLQNIASMLRLQSRRSDSPYVRDEFATSINRIVSIAVAYDIFAHNPVEAVSFRDMLDKIVVSLRETSDSDRGDYQIELDGNDVMVSYRQAVPLALIVNELVTNSMKHAVSQRENGLVRILLRNSQRRILVCVSDNGLSDLPADELENKKSLGLSSIRSLVDEQLGGYFLLKRHKGNTYAIVSFPKDILSGEDL